jgi:alpha-tubulin suppressor-like RCC1 family protein
MSVIGMGHNEKGQLGTGKITYAELVPTTCPGLGDPDLIRAGYESSYCVVADILDALGGGGFGQQGDGRYDGAHPRLLLHPCDIPPIVSIDVYGMHIIAITTDGRVATFGSNGWGNLGIGTRAPSENRPEEGNSAISVYPQLLASGKPVGVSAGFTHSLCWDDEGGVDSWGLNRSGALGTGIQEEYSLVPVQTKIAGVTHAAAGGYHSLFVVGGTVLACGNSDAGQCGKQHVPIVPVPEVVAGLPTDIVGVFAGQTSSYALRSNGDLYEWGHGNPTPRLILGRVTDVSASENNTMAISDGEWCVWGFNGTGQVGNGKRGEDVTVPYHTGRQVKQVASGMNHSLAIV